MATARSAGKTKVYIETPDGMLKEITGYMVRAEIREEVDWDDVTSLSDTVPVYLKGPVEIEMSLEFRGCQMTYSPMDLFAKRTAQEWKCDYCGRPNQRRDETCKSCGAVRSFIWG